MLNPLRHVSLGTRVEVWEMWNIRWDGRLPCYGLYFAKPLVPPKKELRTAEKWAKKAVWRGGISSQHKNMKNYHKIAFIACITILCKFHLGPWRRPPPLTTVTVRTTRDETERRRPDSEWTPKCNENIHSCRYLSRAIHFMHTHAWTQSTYSI